MVKISTSTYTKVRVEIMNGIGQLMNAYSENLSGGKNSLTLKIAGATSTIYMVRFKDIEGKILQTQSFSIK